MWLKGRDGNSSSPSTPITVISPVEAGQTCPWHPWNNTYSREKVNFPVILKTQERSSVPPFSPVYSFLQGRPLGAGCLLSGLVKRQKKTVNLTSGRVQATAPLSSCPHWSERPMVTSGLVLLWCHHFSETTQNLYIWKLFPPAVLCRKGNNFSRGHVPKPGHLHW